MAVTGLSAALLLALSGCGGAADKALATGGSKQDYITGLDQISKGLSEHERAAFNWAVSDMDLAKLHRAYPNGTVRQVIRGEVKQVKDAYPSKIEEWKSKAAAEESTMDELGKVSAKNATLNLSSGFFGIKPTVKATLVNASKLPLSRISWRASLYLNGSDTPVAESILASDFRSIGGLAAERQLDATFQIGFVKGDESWTTLEVRNSTDRRVVLEALPATAMDYSDKRYLASDYGKQIAAYEKALQEAESYSDI
ncbi:hypothetical protein [Stenotrophomonas maltophilia]|uniref:hypothetical protein n=1 Tax=Stenotrophomonas maltophilia TaxID=40324 RepID=UPI0021C8FD34|nr:hypothetical protein [Stenotrophomonas maltophilia]MCU1082907.1 hypothetical protein [Stenotrophomonas maltophilia]